jgi:sodium/proline symporter
MNVFYGKTHPSVAEKGRIDTAADENRRVSWISSFHNPIEPPSTPSSSSPNWQFVRISGITESTQKQSWEGWMAAHETALMITFGLYLVSLIVIGYLGERRFSRSYDDFVSAGKSLGSIVTALSAAASSESAWVMLGLSGLGYAKGLAAYWAVIGCVAGFAVNWLFVIVPVRRISGVHHSLTLADMVEDELEDRKKMLRVIGSIVIVFFMGVYVVSQFVGAGKTLHGMGLMDYRQGVLLGSIIIAAYVLMGGYAAVCWTDALQGLLMALIMVSLPILAIVDAGGPMRIHSVIQSAGLEGFWSLKGLSIWGSVGFIVGQLGIGLGYQGMPHVVVRYITVKNEKEGRRSGMIATVWGILVLAGSVTLGIAGRVLYPVLKDPEHILPRFAAEHLPPVLAGVVLAAITAAIMSTADSQLMYAATSLVNDLWLKLTKRKIQERHLVLATRLVILVMTAIAIFVALLNVKVIYTFVLYAWGALGAAFSPMILSMIYFRRFNKWGALTNLIVGPVTVIIWNNIPVLDHAVYELIPAFFLSLLAGWAVSVLTSRRKP